MTNSAPNPSLGDPPSIAARGGDGRVPTDDLELGVRAFQSVQRFRLTVIAGPDAGRVLDSLGERVVVGSAEGCDLRLTDPTVSRFHCELVVGTEQVALIDLGSRNGTIAGGVALDRGRLVARTELRLGNTTLAFEPRADAVRVEQSTAIHFGRLVGRSDGMRRVFSSLERASRCDSTVLLLGETGTGKELAAESLHLEGARREGPFVVVDCGAIPSTLLEAELFGHERGAFTGASASRPGAFEAAHGGTIFLDEIGELSPELQPKLLRVLEKREVRRIGSNHVRSVDVRVVAATNRELRAEVNAKRFRADLYYRLAVIAVALPPLRERKDDLPELASGIVDRLSSRTVRPSFLHDPEFTQRLERHAWPGNVRELRNYLERCLAYEQPVDFDVTHEAMGEKGDLTIDPDVSRPLRLERQRVVDAFERSYLRLQLARSGGNVTAAARASGVDRMHLYRLLWRAGLK